MDSSKHLGVVVGTRPNFIKAAPFFRCGKQSSKFCLSGIHTGQHFDEKMSEVFFKELNIPSPQYNLEIRGEFHTEKIGKMFSGLFKLFTKEQFDGIVVFGDVNSTLAGAIAAAKANIDLFHIEAGLRSHDRRMPEEINRAIVDHLSSLLFTSEPSGGSNLEKEGVESEKIHPVGNIMIESLDLFEPQIRSRSVIDEFGLEEEQYVVVTIHRQENTDDPKIFEKILRTLKKINKTLPLIFPMHPGTKEKIGELGLSDYLSDIKVIEPLGYFEFVNLMMNSCGVITDSGGIQEETSYLEIPCATIRDNTERPITVEVGTNKLFPLSTLQASEVLSHLQDDKTKQTEVNIDRWDNKVSKRILNRLDKYY